MNELNKSEREKEISSYWRERAIYHETALKSFLAVIIHENPDNPDLKENLLGVSDLWDGAIDRIEKKYNITQGDLPS